MNFYAQQYNCLTYAILIRFEAQVASQDTAVSTFSNNFEPLPGPKTSKLQPQEAAVP
jgi:hypothetical protein